MRVNVRFAVRWVLVALLFAFVALAAIDSWTREKSGRAVTSIEISGTRYSGVIDWRARGDEQPLFTHVDVRFYARRRGESTAQRLWSNAPADLVLESAEGGVATLVAPDGTVIEDPLSRKDSLTRSFRWSDDGRLLILYDIGAPYSGTQFAPLGDAWHLDGVWVNLRVFLWRIGVWVLLLAAIALVLTTRRLWGDGSGRCCECGYDLTGLSSSRCPECGTDIGSNGARQPS